MGFLFAKFTAAMMIMMVMMTMAMTLMVITQCLTVVQATGDLGSVCGEVRFYWFGLFKY